MKKTHYTIEIICNDALMTDAAKAVIPDLIRQMAQQLRARCGFIGDNALQVSATVGSFGSTLEWSQEEIKLEDEETHA